MDNADMSPSSDNENSSDDLIAELARLMAAEAQGESKPQSEQTAQTRPESGFAARAETHSAPAADARSRAEPTFTPRAETPRHSEPHVSPAPPPVSNPSAGAPHTSANPAPEPRFTPPSPSGEPAVESDSFAEMPADIASSAPAEPTSDKLADDDFQFEMPPLRAIDDVDVGRAPQAPEVEPTPSAPEFVSARPTVTVPDPAPVEPAPTAYQQPEPAAQPVVSDEMDPIGALIAAQLEEADAFQPGMAPDETLTPRKQRGDSFGVAPVFGLGDAKSADIQPKVERDPLDDIESLIGAALHTEPGQAPAADAQPAPAEPGIVGAADAAEAAILAATATMRRSEEQGSTTSSAPDSIDFDAESEHPRLSARNDWSGRPKKSGWKSIAGPLVAAALLLAVGLGIYWVFGTNNQLDGEAPVLSADTSPVKQEPDTTAASTDAPRSVVFSETQSDSEPDTIEQLISRDETTDVQGNDVARVITPEAPQDGGLANRKVRTVTVRPDGTIVSGDTAVAGGEQLPVERPNVPELPGGTVSTPVATTPVTVATNEPAGETPPVPLPRPFRTSAPSTPIAAPVTTTAPQQTTNASAVDLIANTANQAVSQPQAAAQPAPVQTAAPFAVASGSSAPAYVQLSSQRTPDAANRSLNEVKARYAAQLGNNTLEVQQVDLGERGIFYRVRMPAQSIEAANSVCSDIKAGGGDCFVRTD
jgi:hypothetical protein